MFTSKKNFGTPPARSETGFGFLSEFRSRTHLFKKFSKIFKNTFLLEESVKATAQVYYARTVYALNTSIDARATDGN